MSARAVMLLHGITCRATAAGWCLMLGYMLAPSSSLAQGRPPELEVEHLLTFIAISNCDFYRNGSWYGGADAQAHMREKLAIVFPGNQSPKAEEFIEKVATKSAFTGIPYQIRCAGEKPMAVSEWLLGELRHYRK
jgi:hypothetical protein